MTQSLFGVVKFMPLSQTALKLPGSEAGLTGCRLSWPGADVNCWPVVAPESTGLGKIADDGGLGRPPVGALPTGVPGMAMGVGLVTPDGVVVIGAGVMGADVGSGIVAIGVAGTVA